MDALDLLRKDHARIYELFDRLVSISDHNPTMRREAYTQLRQALGQHLKVKEEVLYPRFIGETTLAELCRDARVAAAEIRARLDEVDAINPLGARFAEAVAALRVLVEDHFRVEDDELMDLAQDVFGAEVFDQLGQEMEAARDNIIGQPFMGEQPMHRDRPTRGGDTI